jgi:hypothetical protein
VVAALMSAVVRVMTVAVGSIARQAVTPVRHAVPMRWQWR